MSSTMGHTQRIRATLARDEVDRLPVSLWRHNFLREWSAEELADETIQLYRRHDWDLIKVNPRWSYLPEAWGNEYEQPTEQRFQRLLHRVITEPGDLDRIEPADPAHPSLVEQLDAVEMVVDAAGDEVDVIHTVFSPLAVLGLLAGRIGRPLTDFAAENPEGMERAVLAARETVEVHIAAALDRGAAGIFYAPLQWTSLDLCDADFYATYGRPHDLHVLDSMADAPLRVIHLCGNNIAAERFHDYPANVFSWDDRGEGNPTLAEMAVATGATVMAGVPHKRIHRMSPEELVAAAREAVGSLDRGVILAGGCGVGAEVPHDNLSAACAAAHAV